MQTEHILKLIQKSRWAIQLTYHQHHPQTPDEWHFNQLRNLMWTWPALLLKKVALPRQPRYLAWKSLKTNQISCSSFLAVLTTDDAVLKGSREMHVMICIAWRAASNTRLNSRCCIALCSSNSSTQKRKDFLGHYVFWRIYTGEFWIKSSNANPGPISSVIKSVFPALHRKWHPVCSEPNIEIKLIFGG